jgi:hypothetical protein
MAARIAIVSITAYVAVMACIYTVVGTGVDLSSAFSAVVR